MEELGKLVIGETEYPVMDIEQRGHRSMLLLTLGSPPPAGKGDRYAVLVRGANREPVRLGMVHGDRQIDASLVY